MTNPTILRTLHRLCATALPLAVLPLAVLTSCRRDLYVFGTEFHSVTLDTDWREYQPTDPDGMTVWFFPADDSQPPYAVTTANVRHAELYLPAGRYTGVVIDYSPDEYSRQQFTGMDRAATACVSAVPASYQPDAADDGLQALYGPDCFHERLAPGPAAPLYMVSSQPEEMALDTLQDMTVSSGRYGNYIPYEESDTYQQSLTVQQFYAWPVSPIWRLRIRIFIRGYDYLYQTEGSLAGMADGRLLARNRATDTPCLLALQEWENRRTGDNVGYISTTVTTFGLRASQRPHVTYVTDDEGNFVTPPTTRSGSATESHPVITDWAGARLTVPDDLRLNLRFLLRDRQTYVDYHFNVGDCVVSYDDELVLRLDIDEDFPDGPPDLPFVEAFDGAGFDASVNEWEDGPHADATM